MVLKDELGLIVFVTVLYGVFLIDVTAGKPLECEFRMSDKLNAIGQKCYKEYPAKVINSKNPQVSSTEVNYFICLLTGAGVVKSPKAVDIDYSILLKLIDEFPSPRKDRENLKTSITGCRDVVKLTPAKGKQLAESLLQCILFMFYQQRKGICEI